MKVIEKLNSTAENEFSLMWRISHENIVKYYEHFHHVIDEKDCTCIITEYCQVYVQASNLIFNSFYGQKLFIQK